MAYYDNEDENENSGFYQPTQPAQPNGGLKFIAPEALTHFSAGPDSGTTNDTTQGISASKEPASPSTITIPKMQFADPYGNALLNRARNLEVGHAGVNDLYTKAKGIKNPFLRALGEIGARTAQGLEKVGTVTPFINQAVLPMIPGTNLNYNLNKLTAENQLDKYLKESGDMAKQNLETVDSEKDQDKYAVENNYAGPNGEPVTFDPKTNTLSYKDAEGKDQTSGIQRYEKDQWQVVPNAIDPISGTVVERNAITGQVRPVQGVKPFKEGSDHIAQANDYIGPQGQPAYYDPDKQQTFYVGPNGQRSTQGLKRYQAPPQPVQLVVPGQNGAAPKLEAFRPGQEVPNGSQTTSGFSSSNTPTTTQRNRSSVVADSIASTPDITQLIDSNEKEIGPIAGRKNELLLEHGFSNNESLAKLVSEIELLKTGIGMAHFGVRGGPEDFRKIQDSYYSIHQEPNILKSHIAGGLQYLQHYLNTADKTKLGEEGLFASLPPEVGGKWTSEAAKQTNTQGPPQPAGKPAGATHTVTFNGKQYYADDEGNNLGEVKKK